MKKVIIIISVILVLGIAVTGVFLLKPKGEELGFGAETVPCGLTWGMTSEEVCNALDESGYPKHQVPAVGSTVIYQVMNYQGVSGANGTVMLFFGDTGKLESATYKFSSDATGKGPLVTQTMLDDLEFSFQKVYEDSCSAVYKLPKAMTPNTYYMCGQSLVSTWRQGEAVWVDYIDLNSETGKQILSEISAYRK